MKGSTGHLVLMELLNCRPDMEQEKHFPSRASRALALYVKFLRDFSPGNFHDKKMSFFVRNGSKVIVQSYLLNVRGLKISKINK